MKTTLLAGVLLAAAACATPGGGDATNGNESARSERMSIGAFSVSLAVKDLAASRAFYEKLGFEAAGGDPAQNWLVLRNADTTIGLFQGMFDKNILTFNPGWDREARPLASFEDVRALQRRFRDAGLTFQAECDESGSSPASFVLVDPDGNPILVDQHVP